MAQSPDGSVVFPAALMMAVVVSAVNLSVIRLKRAWLERRIDEEFTHVKAHKFIDERFAQEHEKTFPATDAKLVSNRIGGPFIYPWAAVLIAAVAVSPNGWGLGVATGFVIGAGLTTLVLRQMCDERDPRQKKDGDVG